MVSVEKKKRDGCLCELIKFYCQHQHHHQLLLWTMIVWLFVSYPVSWRGFSMLGQNKSFWAGFQCQQDETLNTLQLIPLTRRGRCRPALYYHVPAVDSALGWCSQCILVLIISWYDDVCFILACNFQVKRTTHFGMAKKISFVLLDAYWTLSQQWRPWQETAYPLQAAHTFLVCSFVLFFLPLGGVIPRLDYNVCFLRLSHRCCCFCNVIDQSDRLV